MAHEPRSHGEQRRTERRISLEDLQAALKYAEPMPAEHGRQKFTHNGVTAIVAEGTRGLTEVTSYRDNRPVRDHQEEAHWKMHGEALRFSIGERVECNLGDEWRVGRVRQLQYREHWFTKDQVAAYQVELFDVGSLIYVPEDTDKFVRAAPYAHMLPQASADGFCSTLGCHATSLPLEYVYGATADQLAAVLEDQHAGKSAELALMCLERLAALLGKSPHDISGQGAPLYCAHEIAEHTHPEV